jgi:hypothetical protein
VGGFAVAGGAAWGLPAGIVEPPSVAMGGGSYIGMIAVGIGQPFGMVAEIGVGFGEPFGCLVPGTHSRYPVVDPRPGHVGSVPECA